MGRKRKYFQKGEISEVKSKIITDIYNSGVMDELLKNMARGQDKNNVDDLRQDIFEWLLNYPDEKLKNLTDDNQIKFFLVRMLSNQINSVTSKYYRQYRLPSILTKELPQENDDNEKEEVDYYDTEF